MFSMFISLKMAKHSKNYAEFLGDKRKLNNAGTNYEVELKEEAILKTETIREDPQSVCSEPQTRYHGRTATPMIPPLTD